MNRYPDHIVRYRDALLRAAHAKLRNGAWAEDAVSETLLAAWERPPGFDDPSRLRAWLFGVLQHKLVDQLRRYGPDNSLVCVGGWADVAQFAEADNSGYADPPRCAGAAQFVQGLCHALAELPDAHARAFMLCEVYGHNGEDICAELGVSIGNLRVMLFRARAKLRMGLQAHWA